jgi:hypothetical protein
MSFEQMIIQRQAFRHDLREYLSFISAMSTDEIELALGRLADMLLASMDAQKMEIAIKGTVLKIYFDMRRSGKKSQSMIKRFALWSSMMRFRDEEGRKSYARALQDWEQKYAAWKRHIQRLSLYKRIIAIEPAKPRLHSYKRMCRMRDFLLAQATLRRLNHIPASVDDVKLTDIALLAP